MCEMVEAGVSWESWYGRLLIMAGETEETEAKGLGVHDAD
jgi:hypothetical protein